MRVVTLPQGCGTSRERRIILVAHLTLPWADGREGTEGKRGQINKGRDKPRSKSNLGILVADRSNKG